MNFGIVTVLSLCSGLSYGASYYDHTALSPIEDLVDYPTDVEASPPPQCCQKRTEIRWNKLEVLSNVPEGAEARLSR